MTHTRLVGTDTIMSSITKLVEGNPGALTVCMALMKDNARIDPDDAFKEIGPLLSLDTEGIYGSRIWMLYKDVCGQDTEKVLGLLRARQLGYLNTVPFQHAIDNYGDGLDVDAFLSKVKERLPKFGKK